MNSKRTLSDVDRRRLRAANEITSNLSAMAAQELPQDGKYPNSHEQGKKRKIVSQEPFDARRNYVHKPPQFMHEDRPNIDEAELQLLIVESQRLDFEVSKWKQQQALRRETLQLKSEEISLKEATTKQKQETQMMEIRAKVFDALEKAGKGPDEVNEYFALLQG
ncbi:uncharacterized protein PHALS_12236 [Plasmopara halstedii]|uniref:Uncharacterized protein n=1 Tax=Plasmopara halstedii TaxID=4781 RepID=A0A0P1AM01_PLAHL|nr:uncharacterized protein PHALS_12236 [Plasmopara halstedii]CEG41924.1 hypothetical protein PHALS_12236 [Plasmopara halstedii]|eukprot:XP_024578293.1 hypothetical protein PHALS_12236 [Plasmopara halstedii]